jgi:transposase-like protein
VLHGTRVGLRTWFLAFFFLGRHKKGISALQFQRDTGLGSCQTAWALLHKVRSGLHGGAGFLLTGNVDVDETDIGGPEKGLRGGCARGRKAIVAVAMSRATVCTDAWRGYGGLAGRAFCHRSETQGKRELAVESSPWAHTIFSNLKTWLRGTHNGVSKKHLDRYLLEFVYRFNRRRFDHALFEHVIRAAAIAPALTYRQITAERIG